MAHEAGHGDSKGLSCAACAAGFATAAVLAGYLLLARRGGVWGGVH